MREFIEELENNQKINLEKGLENKVDISYVIERLENIVNNDDVYGYIKHLEDLTAKKENIIKEAKDYIDKYLEREYFDTDILENNTIYNRDLFKTKQILDKGE